MTTITIHNELVVKAKGKSLKVVIAYRGFSSIDQEIEREIAMQWFSSGKKSSFSQRNFLLKKECL